jgi:hypothetical protein
MKKTMAFAFSAILGLSSSGAALAQAAGIVAEVKEGGRQVVIKTFDGKDETYNVSASGTKVTVAGKDGREGLKVGLTCSVTGRAGGDATAITC